MSGTLGKFFSLCAKRLPSTYRSRMPIWRCSAAGLGSSVPKFGDSAFLRRATRQPSNWSDPLRTAATWRAMSGATKLPACHPTDQKL